MKESSLNPSPGLRPPSPMGRGNEGEGLPKTRAFLWKKDRLLLLDQCLLPNRAVWRHCRAWREVADAIRSMIVRGAPAIGCAAAYGIVLASQSKRSAPPAQQRKALEQASAGLLLARPTAVNLRWALERMRRVWTSPDSPDFTRRLEREAQRIEAEDREANQAIGRHGARLLPSGATVLTHCNTGSLATAGYGTAFGVIWAAFQARKIRKVLVTETRPCLQGSRLTAWELQHEKIPFELITDNMAAHLMQTEVIHAVIVGADRIAANGDVANKIGTYNLAVLADRHRIPFYVAAPTSTIDLTSPEGRTIPIEERPAKEVTMIQGARIAPRGAKARHPAFDVTPAELVTAIITERGIVKPPYVTRLNALIRGTVSLMPAVARQAVAIS